MSRYILCNFNRLIFTKSPRRVHSFQTFRQFNIATAIAPKTHDIPDARIFATTATMTLNTPSIPLDTRILPVDSSEIGTVSSTTTPWIDDWSFELSDSSSVQSLREAARQLRETDIPVAFPTETVYGLGADATRDDAVKAIFRVKGRPSDNPLIVHFASIRQIRQLLQPDDKIDPIPSIYKPLIEKFWPGPLTILLPLPNPSPLAPSVTVGLKTFGARIPRNPVALALLRLADVPVAAPSANASTRPSPTAAEHVAHDLEGRISLVLDGGPCDVGVESTVVDGLCSPPAILRPGGVSVEQLRECKGWEGVRIAYADKAEDKSAPRAPGMKYRHYSPRAKVLLYESGQAPVIEEVLKVGESIGFVITKEWRQSPFFKALNQETPESELQTNGTNGVNGHPQLDLTDRNGTLPTFFSSLLPSLAPVPVAHATTLSNSITGQKLTVWSVDLGPDTKDVARGFFSALRELDRKDIGTIFVEGLDENEGDVAVAVMNRLRKAAEVQIA
jgi:L-threonylcarbamoyladenylate synthase